MLCSCIAMAQDLENIAKELAPEVARRMLAAVGPSSTKSRIAFLFAAGSAVFSRFDNVLARQASRLWTSCITDSYNRKLFKLVALTPRFRATRGRLVAESKPTLDCASSASYAAALSNPDSNVPSFVATAASHFFRSGLFI